MAEIAAAVWSWLRDPDREDDQVWLRFRSGLPAGVAAERVREALTAEGESAGPDGLSFGSTVAPTPEGPAVLVEVFGLADRLPVMAAELDRAGVGDGRIELYEPPAHRVLVAPTPVPYLECRLAVHAERLPPWPWNAIGAWAVDPDVQDRIVAAAVDWCLALPGRHTAVWTYAELVAADVTPGQARDLLGAAVRAGFAAPQPTAREIRLVVESGPAFRTVVLAFKSGHVSFVDGAVDPAAFHPDSSWSAVTEPLADADWALRGFVKRGDDWSAACGFTLARGWVPFPADWSGAGLGRFGWGPGVLQRVVEQHASLDAFGALLLPDGEAERVRGGDAWIAEPVGGLTLLRHHDPNAWFASPQPDSAKLAAARHDLAALLPGNT